MPRNTKKLKERVEKIDFDAVQHPLFPSPVVPHLLLFRLQTQIAEAAHEITDILP